MKKTIGSIIVLMFVFSGMTFSQIKKGCNDFKNYSTMVKDHSNLKEKEFDDLTAYGATPQEAKYNAKIQILALLTGNQQYLNNPRVDSILAEFAGELDFLIKDEYDVFKTRRKFRDLGKYTCIVYRTKYNQELIDYLQYYLNNFIKYSVVFIINPYIDQNADILTKELYQKALAELKSQFLQPKYKFDNVIEDRMLEKAKLQPKPADYNPAEGYKVYKTGNKYLDYVLSITNNANRSRQVDVIISVDTIKIVTNGDNRTVTFHIIAYDTHTATLIMDYNSEYTVQKSNDYDAVDAAIPFVFKQDIDNYMYDMVKRYSSYIRDGVLFSLKIAGTLLDDDKTDDLEYALSECKLFAEGSINPGEWRNNGEVIGKTYEGRTYLIDRLRLKMQMKQLLKNVGLTNFRIDVSGSDYIVTPKQTQ